MFQFVKWLCRGLLAAAVLCLWAAVRFETKPWQIAALAAVSLAYHAWMRLIVSNTVNAVMHNHADYHRRRYQVSDAERWLYRKLDVKHWKNRLPSYDPDSFDPRLHSWDELAQTTCQSETVHSTNALLSLLPLLFVRRLPGAWIARLLCVLGSCADCVFVILQRFNRDRMVRMMARHPGKIR